jgi:hypothetical protein
MMSEIYLKYPTKIVTDEAKMPEGDARWQIANRYHFSRVSMNLREKLKFVAASIGRQVSILKKRMSVHGQTKARVTNF